MSYRSAALHADLVAPMAPACEIMLDLERGTLDVRSQGLWDEATTDRFLAEMEEVLRRFATSRRAPETLLTMIDLRQHRIQQAETIARVQPHIPRYHMLSQRTAVLLSKSALAKIQAERLLAHNTERYGYFTSEPVARKWLATGLEGVS